MDCCLRVVSETNVFWLCVGSMMDKGKKAKLDDEEGSELDTELVMAIEKLQEVQDELERVSLFSLIFSPSSFIMDTKGNCCTDFRNYNILVNATRIYGFSLGFVKAYSIPM